MKYKRFNLMSIFFITVCAGTIGLAFGEDYLQVRLGGFSPDRSKLSIKYCTTEAICKFGFVDLKINSFVEIIPEESDMEWNPGGFSPDSLSMAVYVLRKSENGEYSQVGIVSLKNLNFTQLTSGESFRTAPSFSHDGNKIIFSRANRKRTTGATRFADWDIYEISTDGRNERRLTAYNFYQISPPLYLPKDEKFIFSGDSPRTYTSASGDQGRHAYTNEYKENRIFLLPLEQKQQVLRPYFYNNEFSDYPSISSDGSKVIYRARTDKLDGVKNKFTYDLFMFDGINHRRMTRMEGQVSESVLSPKGDRAAFVVVQYEQPKKSGIYLLDVETGQTEKLDFTSRTSK